ncbi:Eukaryotic cytochrome b561 [Geosmithia morbida]|uniref:Eukaryotic cytochrome b561 n=1 Tax=Geosmithia morbida TaxID=1094350 RepID=A0A9P4YZ54_9HYPO|nr:Eukaryotic cytochrome b561 [Geosmithia morbida]KAF4125751.1 Eukaryotic cytochrome b561 [Geosmithia morbida]
MRAHRSHAWAAIGLGSDDMPGALVLMMYDNHDETNVTFSPRIAHGHREPEYFPAMDYEIYSGTGIYNEHMVVAGRCLSNCLSWPLGEDGRQRGAIDVSSQSQGAMYALGPLAGFNSDHPRSSVQYHVQYGSFSMNMSDARGATAPLSVDLARQRANDGTELTARFIRKADVLATVHAVCMVMAFVLVMPLGAVMLRLGHAVRWHALTQSSAMVVVIVGFGVGVATSLRYQRSRGFDSYHQILGIIITIFVLGQFCLGFYNHRLPPPRRRTLISKAHPWVGRFIIFFGIMNGFLGFTFGMNRRYAIILAALIIAMCVAIFLTIVGKRFLTRRRERRGASRNSAPRSMRASPSGRPFERLPTYPPHGPPPSWPAPVPAPGFAAPPPGQHAYYYPPPQPPSPLGDQQSPQHQFRYQFQPQQGVVLHQQPVVPGTAGAPPAPDQAYQPPPMASTQAPRELI